MPCIKKKCVSIEQIPSFIDTPLWHWCIFKQRNCSQWLTLLSNSVFPFHTLLQFIYQVFSVHVGTLGRVQDVALWKLQAIFRLGPSQSSWQWFSCVHHCVAERHIPVRAARPPLSVDICLVLVAAVSRLRFQWLRANQLLWLSGLCFGGSGSACGHVALYKPQLHFQSYLLLPVWRNRREISKRKCHKVCCDLVLLYFIVSAHACGWDFVFHIYIISSVFDLCAGL